MHRRELLTIGAGLALPALVPGLARAQAAYPDQPIRLVVPFSAGGPTDVPARLIADEMSKLLPQRVIVDNRTGAGTVLGADAVAKGPKDGYSILYTTIAHAAIRAIYPTLPFDPVKDFAPVALTGVIPMMLMVNKDLPVSNLRELIDLLKKNPGKYDYASTGNGAALHLATELFLKQAGGLKVTHVPYRGSAAAIPDLLAGNVALMLDVANSAMPFVQSGQVKGIAISSAQRLPQMPDMPTFGEAGVPGYEAYTWHMVLAPAGTPQPVIAKLNATINQVMAMDSVKQRLADLTMQTRSDSTPASTAQWLNDEIAKWEPIIKGAGIKAD
jgi:tripartite-type tricarboxylate transporter receptor subunit TctC